jgi:aspartate racemase
VHCIGLLGGMSWESSIEYERMINEGVRARLGGTHSADLIVRSYDFAAIEALQRADRWEEAGALLATDARRLQDAGAEVIVLCTNTMHVCASAIEAAIDVPFLHLTDAGAEGVITGCTEIELLLGAGDLDVPWFPTTRIHADAAVETALASGGGTRT